MIKSFISSKPKVKIEISGSVNLNNINKFVIKGVHYISIGDLTKILNQKIYPCLLFNCMVMLQTDIIKMHG